MKSRDIYSYLHEQLVPVFTARDAEQHAYLLAEFVAASNTSDWQSLADRSVERLLKGEPVQYIIGYVWFYHLKLMVTPAVLIPRPETEELVDWLIQDYRKGLIHKSPSILDAGTGSGCIALAISKQITEAIVTGIDVSGEALKVARANAILHQSKADFQCMDILHADLHGVYDVIISNPPYISKEEFSQLSPSVRNFEPAIALTPEENDALIFYRKIAELGKTHLTSHGWIYAELNEFRAEDIRSIFADLGYSTEMRKDMQGKWRMLKATREKSL